MHPCCHLWSLHTHNAHAVECGLGDSSDSDAALQSSSAVPILLTNGLLAFGLNLSVFLLIGKTSALSMNVAGVVKDWGLIGLSVFVFGAQVRRRCMVTPLQGACCTM